MNNNTPENKPQYVLVDDVTGRSEAKPIIKAYDFEIQVPRSPNPKCKKCYGKGFIGKNEKTGKPILCHKCYKNYGV